MLTPEPTQRIGRALAAAHARHQAGASDSAARLLSLAEAGPTDNPQRTQVALLRAQIAFTTNRGNDAAPLLLTAARPLESLDVSLARDTYLDAFTSALFAGPLADRGGVREVAEAARAAPRPARPAMRLTSSSMVWRPGSSMATRQPYQHCARH